MAGLFGYYLDPNDGDFRQQNRRSEKPRSLLHSRFNERTKDDTFCCRRRMDNVVQHMGRAGGEALG